MMLTTEKAEKLTEYLTDDLNRAKKLFAIPLSMAVNQIRSDGLDYTEQELRDYVEYIRTSLSENGSEISEPNLDDVSGGYGAKSRSAIFATILGDGACRWIW